MLQLPPFKLTIARHWEPIAGSPKSTALAGVARSTSPTTQMAARKTRGLDMIATLLEILFGSIKSCLIFMLDEAQ
jgi:hypothetical protein